MNWVGGCEMCVGELQPDYRELNMGKLHTRLQRARQVEAEVFLAAGQVSDPRGGGGSGLPHHEWAAQRGWWSSCARD
ncbi:unnamed protein product [Miscanthus lutarioriparius]|uniref:Uncharacterized protein n=1 Tax=Miscanthus lutarioriparius TaxID=422564 RepID=A0A811PPK7_9POAL|nr:unnamed protein product [Miscanthus lutarioriparius]